MTAKKSKTPKKAIPKVKAKNIEVTESAIKHHVKIEGLQDIADAIEAIDFDGIQDLAEAINEQTRLHREMWDEVKGFVVFGKMALDIAKDELLSELTEKVAEYSAKGKHPSPLGSTNAPPVQEIVVKEETTTEQDPKKDPTQPTQ